MNAIRISLTEKNGEIKGTIQAAGDGTFKLEALVCIVENFATSFRVDPSELLNDIKAFIAIEKKSSVH